MVERVSDAIVIRIGSFETDQLVVKQGQLLVRMCLLLRRQSSTMRRQCWTASGCTREVGVLRLGTKERRRQDEINYAYTLVVVLMG